MLRQCLCIPPRLSVHASTLCIFEFVQELIVIYSGLPAFLTGLLFNKVDVSWAESRWSLNNNQLSWAPLQPYPMGLFQAELWRDQSLLSWIPGLWDCFSLFSLPKRSWTPPSHGRCSQGCLWPSQSQQAPHCWWVWGPAQNLSSLAPLLLWGRGYQWTPGTF